MVQILNLGHFRPISLIFVVCCASSAVERSVASSVNLLIALPGSNPHNLSHAKTLQSFQRVLYKKLSTRERSGRSRDNQPDVDSFQNGEFKLWIYLFVNFTDNLLFLVFDWSSSIPLNF